MIKDNSQTANNEATLPTPTSGPSRRKFLTQVSAALATGAVLGKIPRAAAQAGSGSAAPAGTTDSRVRQAYSIRVAAATRQAQIPVPPHTTNGDEQLYPDKSGTIPREFCRMALVS